jgi:hypothetical protein
LIEEKQNKLTTKLSLKPIFAARLVACRQALLEEKKIFHNLDRAKNTTKKEQDSWRKQKSKNVSLKMQIRHLRGNWQRHAPQ